MHQVFTFATIVILYAFSRGAIDAAEVEASSTRDGSSPAGPTDTDRFSVEPSKAWFGRADGQSWWWQCHWDQPRDIGTILQVVGDDPLELQHAPRRYVWQYSLDGANWTDLSETAIDAERRLYRVHPLKKPTRMTHLRMRIESVIGEFPVLRHVETFNTVDAMVPFPDWVVAVSTVDRDEFKKNKGEGKQFVPLVHQCQGFEQAQAQFVWLDSFDEQFVSCEPRPLCAFLSGNFSDFCQKDRSVWRGTDEVVKAGHLPIWAACGSAQGLAILADTGVDKPWDCPHCRDPLQPKSPIYGHIGHRSSTLRKCSDYSECLFERGQTRVLSLVDDPVLRELPREFEIMESHCGQIEYAPKGWIQIVTKGTGGLTSFQCLRVKDRYIYAAQFHIEMTGTPENSRQIMTNFLTLAKEWGGYNPLATPVDVPRSRDAGRSPSIPERN